MPFFPKPADGSWTDHFGLDTADVSYEDSISPEQYEAEREAIFRRTWLNVGRVEQVPRKGNYFTKELDAAGTSVIVVRDGAGGVRAFHNICRHRGNKLVWNDYPREETSGVCRQFTMTFDGTEWTMSRTDPDMHQRFVAAVEQDRIRGRWEASDDQGGTWRKDFDLTFERT